MRAMHIDRKLPLYTLLSGMLGQFSKVSAITCRYFWRKPENTQEAHMDTGKTLYEQKPELRIDPKITCCTTLILIVLLKQSMAKSEFC